jgi:hypothetical protein
VEQVELENQTDSQAGQTRRNQADNETPFSLDNLPNPLYPYQSVSFRPRYQYFSFNNIVLLAELKHKYHREKCKRFVNIEIGKLRLIAKGLSSAEISERLLLPEGTVRNHVSAAPANFNVTARTRAAVIAFQHGRSES